ncbi:MAG: peptidase M28, partial [Leeuwenhoekiella sp.]|nr:peptidase M28 [Leeuwenhoekiella sp.]
MKNAYTFAFLLCFGSLLAQNNVPSQTDLRIYGIIDAVSATNIEKDVRALADFGTRNTFSDTLSDTRGIGAARRYIKAEFEKTSKNCNSCLEVFYQKDLVTPEMGNRIPKETYVVNVVAIQR